jgi:hypothetical protein
LGAELGAWEAGIESAAIAAYGVADDEVAAVDEVSTEDPGGRSTLPAWDRAAPLEPTTSGGKGIGTEDGFANILNTGSDVDGSIVQARKSISGSVPGSFAPT